MNILRAVGQWIFLLASNIILDGLGLIVVALAIPLRVPGKSLSDQRPITNLPRWLHIWGNDYDGLLGDKRMWWRDNCDAQVWFGIRPLLRRLLAKLGTDLPQLDVNSYLAMWWWAAVRNPTNNMRLYSLWQAPVRGSTITYKGDAVVEDNPGKGGWQFVTTENDGKRWYGFYLVHQWNKDHALVIRLGFKVEPQHQGQDVEPKGMTTKINFYKSI